MTGTSLVGCCRAFVRGSSGRVVATVDRRSPWYELDRRGSRGGVDDTADDAGAVAAVLAAIFGVDPVVQTGVGVDDEGDVLVDACGPDVPLVFPVACDSRMEREPLGVSSGLHTPPLPAAHAEVGTGIGHLPGITSPASAVPLPTHPLTTRTFVSHACRPILPDPRRPHRTHPRRPPPGSRTSAPARLSRHRPPLLHCRVRCRRWGPGADRSGLSGQAPFKLGSRFPRACGETRQLESKTAARRQSG